MGYRHNESFMKMIKDNENSIWHHPDKVKALLENENTPVTI